MSAGYYATCGLDVSGGAYCWGTGREGELGANSAEQCNEEICATSPLEVGEMLTRIAVGGTHACGLRVSGTVVCWGDGTYGQLGFPPPIPNCSPTSTGCARLPRAVSLPAPAAALSAGGSHNCVLDAAGAATCWGYNQAGRLGTGDQTTRFQPESVITDLRFIAIAAGGTHTCAVAQDGHAYCWGYNHLGQLGDGTTASHPLPMPVATDVRFVDVVTGIAHTCARTALGAVYCWGAGGEGQLGTDAPLSSCELYGCSLVPVRVAGEHAFTALSAGTFTCGVAADGSFCWGASGLGDTTFVPQPFRTRGPTGDAFQEMSVGYDHGCGIAAGSRAYCWGSDHVGKLGDGPGEGGPMPVLVRQAADSLRPL